MWETGTWISKFILIMLVVMSVGTWYIFFTKYFEQQRILGQARTVEKSFWTSATLNEGIDKLPKNSMFRGIAEAGITRLHGRHQPGRPQRLDRHVADPPARRRQCRLQGGDRLPGLGRFGRAVRRSVRHGVGHSATPSSRIGVAGQASIDKVAGPVGEALIMTAIGLVVAVPAVLLYNYLVRRNKVITEKLRAFAGDLQTYLITKSK